MEAKTYSDFKQAMIDRDQYWDPYGLLPVSFRGMELAGELGELLNVVKKIERSGYGIDKHLKKRYTPFELNTMFEEETGDVIICLNLLFIYCDRDDLFIDHPLARKKFNESSEKLGLPFFVEV